MVSNEGPEMIIDQPWQVRPNSESMLCVAKSGRRLMLMGNLIRDGDGAM